MRRMIVLAIILTAALGMACAREPAAAPAPSAPEHVYVFNEGSKDVTVIDAQKLEVVRTLPLGAQVRWLANELSFFDGKHIWAYDSASQGEPKPVDVILVDPKEMKVVQRIAVGNGPSFGVSLTKDKKWALLALGSENVVAVVDVEKRAVARKVPTGKFPCDLDLSTDGKLAYVPERDSDTVSALDLKEFKLVKTVSQPKDSKPFMLRVNPKMDQVWVQNSRTNNNPVFKASNLEVLKVFPTGKVPLTNAFSPDGKFAYIVHASDDFVQVVDTTSFETVKRIPVGTGARNVSVRPDGKLLFVVVASTNSVAVIDTEKLEVTKTIPVGQGPFGIVVMKAPS